MVTMNNSDLNINSSLPAKYRKSCNEYEKMFSDYVYEDSDVHGITYKAISIGKAVKSVIDADNPKSAEKLALARARLNCYKYVAALYNAWFHYLKELVYGNLLVTTNTPECTTNGGLYDQWLYYQSLVEKEKYYISKLLSEL